MAVNLSTKGIEDFRFNLENLPSLFYQVNDDLDDTKNNAIRIFNKNDIDIDECIKFRTKIYEKALANYMEVFNRTKDIKGPNGELNMAKMDLDSASDALDEAKKTKKIINDSYEEFCDIFSHNSEIIDSDFDDLSARIKIVANELNEFVEEIKISDNELKSIEIINTNSALKVNLNSLDATTEFATSSKKPAISSIKSVISSFLIGSQKTIEQGELKRSYFANNLQREKFAGLKQTNEEWHMAGDFESYNSPEQTGKRLDSNQGKFGNFLGTCGCVSCLNVLLLAGIEATESEVVLFASTHTDEDGATLCVSGSNDAESNGGTTPVDRQNILTAYGVESTCKPATIENIFLNVGEGRGVIASVHADMLYRGMVADNDYHAVTITSVKTKNGKPYSVTICDSNNMPSEEYTVEEFKRALTGQALNITTQIIR